ncbi:hypothetical protein FJZ31_19475 [Candidatus Poribacteria bacterium]|nr:hypothetical protein [Candidatus Poribacteria bacterium]
MKVRNDGNLLQSGMSELKKITVFQIISIAVIFIMGAIIISSIIGSTLWLWLLLILGLAGGISLFILLIIIPASRIEELLRITVDENKNLTRQNSALKKQSAHLQGFNTQATQPFAEPSQAQDKASSEGYLPQFEQDEIQPKGKASEDIAAELSFSDNDIAGVVTSPTPLVCSIIQPQDGMTIQKTYRILVESTAGKSIAKVGVSFDVGKYIDITNQFDGVHYYYDWEIKELGSGIHTIDVRVVDSSPTPQTVNAKQVKVKIDNLVKKLKINIKTYQETYQLNSMLRVEVKVIDNFGEAVRNAIVDVTIYDADNSIQAAGQGMTNANGIAYFGSEIMMDDPIGTYTIEARVSMQGYESGMESTTFEVEEAKRQSG